MHVRAELAETADRRARRHAPPLPAHPAGCTPGDHAGGRPGSGNTPSARHRQTRGAVLTSYPCSTHVADARIGAYGRSPLANRSASQPRRVGARDALAWDTRSRCVVDSGLGPGAVRPEARAGLRGHGTYSGGSLVRAGQDDLGSCVAAGGPCSGIPDVAVSPLAWPISVAGLAAYSANPARPDEVTQFRPPARGGGRRAAGRVSMAGLFRLRLRSSSAPPAGLRSRS